MRCTPADGDNRTRNLIPPTTMYVRFRQSTLFQTKFSSRAANRKSRSGEAVRLQSQANITM